MTDYVPLVGKQSTSAALATARYNIWEGAVRSSKTVSSILRWLRYVRTGPAGPLLMVGKTERTLKRNIIDPIQEMVGAKRCRFKVGAGEVDLLGRTIYTAGAHDESSADKIKGLTLAGAYGDEITTWPESFYTMLGTRLSVPGAAFFGTTNPAAATHWLRRNYLTRARLHIDLDGQRRDNTDPDALDIHRFSFQLADNPSLTPEYVDSISREYSGLFYRRYIRGEWVNAEGAVFEGWDHDRHVVADLPRIDRWLACGIDYGTTNPFAALLLGVGTGPDGMRRLYITHEYRHDSRAARRQLTDPEYSEAVQRWLATADRPQENARGIHPEWIYVDPSAASFSLQLYRDGVPHVAHANNSVLDGIHTMAGLIASDRLRVHASCRGLIDEMPSYSWDDKATDKGEDRPLKEDDHSVDAARYAIFTTEHQWRSLLAIQAQLQ